MPRSDRDLSLIREMPDGEAGLGQYNCQERFNFSQIVSCIPGRKPEGWSPVPSKPMFSGHQPQYELRNDGSGEPYTSIVELRSDKIINFLGVAEWHWIDAVLSMQYEDLLKQGTEILIKEIQRRTGVEPRFLPTPPQTRMTRTLNYEFATWMKKHVNWDVEALIGYDKQLTIKKFS